MMEDELLQRIARTLRKDIGPAIEDEYPRTQAFMAAVVAQKLGRQIGLARDHEAAAHADAEALVADLRVTVEHSPVPPAVADAIGDYTARRDDTALSAVIEALYAERAALGEERFRGLLARVRQTMRSAIDRRMAVAG